LLLRCARFLFVGLECHWQTHKESQQESRYHFGKSVHRQAPRY
jgi:hypothetical protein